MTEPSAPPGEEQPVAATIPLSCVGEEFAAMADFFRQRLLARAHQIDGLKDRVGQLDAALRDTAVQIDALAAQIKKD